MVSSLRTIHHHQYPHQFSQTLTIGGTGLGGEFEFLEKSYKNQTGENRPFQSISLQIWQKAGTNSACSPTRCSTPTPPSWSQFSQACCTSPGSLCVSRHESLADGEHGTSSREWVTCLPLSMPGLISPHRRQGCPTLSHIKHSPAFSLPSLRIRNKNSIWAIKRQHLFKRQHLSNACRLPEIQLRSPFLLRLSSNIQNLSFAFGREIRQEGCYFNNICAIIQVRAADPQKWDPNSWPSSGRSVRVRGSPRKRG